MGKLPQAVGKLFSSKPGFAEGMAQTLGKIWCPQKGVRCKELGSNLFLFSFLQPGGKRRAIMEGPWEFRGDLLVVVDFDESKRLKYLEFTHIPVWMRVFDLPLGLMNFETGRRIGNSVGKFMEVDFDEDDMVVGEYLRIKVLIDIRKPLSRGIMVEQEEGEEGTGAISNMNSSPIFATHVATSIMWRRSVMKMYGGRGLNNLASGCGPF